MAPESLLHDMMYTAREVNRCCTLTQDIKRCMYLLNVTERVQIKILVSFTVLRRLMQGAARCRGVLAATAQAAVAVAAVGAQRACRRGRRCFGGCHGSLSGQALGMFTSCRVPHAGALPRCYSALLVPRLRQQWRQQRRQRRTCPHQVRRFRSQAPNGSKSFACRIPGRDAGELCQIAVRFTTAS